MFQSHVELARAPEPAIKSARKSYKSRIINHTRKIVEVCRSSEIITDGKFLSHQPRNVVKAPRIQLFCGDCRMVIGQIADKHSRKNLLFCSDLPYNIKYKHYDACADDLTPEKYIELLSTFRGYRAAFIHYPEGISNLAVPALGPFARSIMWCYRSTCSRSSRQIGFWNVKPDFKQVRRPFTNPTKKQREEIIAQGRNDTSSYDWWDDIEPLKGVSHEKKNAPHPCPVPIELMKRILSLCARKGDIVVDPFAGVQTTGIAAHQLGLDYIGIELSPNYVKAGAKRINRLLGIRPEVYRVNHRTS